MSTIITVEQIGLCRKGSDIDLEAVFGGRISQRKQKGLKVNPIYQDAHGGVKFGPHSRDHNANMNGLHIETYETFPRSKDRVFPKGSGSHAVASVAKSRVMGENKVKMKQNGDLVREKLQNGHHDNTKEHNELQRQVNDSDLTGIHGVRNPAYLHNESETNSPSPASARSSAGSKLDSETLVLAEVHVHVPDDISAAELRTDLTSDNSLSPSDWPDIDGTLVTVKDTDVKSGAQADNNLESSAVTIDTDNLQNGGVPPSDPVSVSQSGTDGRLADTIVNGETLPPETVPRNDSNSVTKHQTYAIAPDQDSGSRDSALRSSSVSSHGEGISDNGATAGVQAVESSSVPPESEQPGTSSDNDSRPNSGQSKTYSSSTKTLKSILASSVTGDTTPHIERSRSKSESQSECHEKSVKFSDDTVFNENKPSKYKKERLEKIHLRDIYRGKISSDSAVAKLNPLFQDDLDLKDEEEHGSLTDDQKVAYRLSVRQMMNSKHDRAGSLNTPSYMDRYLVLKTHGFPGTEIDMESLPPGMEVPAYNRLISRTIAKQRRKLIVKWTLVILTVLIVTAVATVLGVFFGNKG